MTRINLVPPSELCDQHLLAEFRELTRIPNCVLKGKYRFIGQPSKYTLGPGHVKFFYSKMLFLYERYNELFNECCFRGFNVVYIFPEMNLLPSCFKQNYIPTEEAIALNRARIAERLENMKPRFTKRINPRF